MSTVALQDLHHPHPAGRGSWSCQALETIDKTTMQLLQTWKIRACSSVLHLLRGLIGCAMQQAWLTSIIGRARFSLGPLLIGESNFQFSGGMCVDDRDITLLIVLMMHGYLVAQTMHGIQCCA